MPIASAATAVAEAFIGDRMPISDNTSLRRNAVSLL
jgi:hypothetical protein